MKKKILCILIAAMFLILAFTGCAANKKDYSSATKISDFSDARIGIVTGSIPAMILPEMLPDAEFFEFNSFIDSALALESNKVDVFCAPEAVCSAMSWEGLCFRIVEERLIGNEVGIIFGKKLNPKLQEEFDTFLKEFSESGELEKLKEKWFSNNEPDTFIDYEKLSGTNGNLKIAISTTQKPFTYLKNGKYAGHDVEMLTAFAEKYGYSLEFVDTNFSAFINGVAVGTYDMGASGIAITEERKENLDFSAPYYNGAFVMAVSEGGNVSSAEKIETISDLSGKKIGVMTGSIQAIILPEMLPDAEYNEYNSISDAAIAVESGKIDAFSVEESVYLSMLNEGRNFDRIEEPIGQSNYAFIFGKGMNKELQKELNSFIAKSKENGTHQALVEKWFSGKEPEEFIDYTKLSGTNGTIKLAVFSGYKPFCYIKNGSFAGFDIELLYAFAKEKGYKLEISDLPAASLLTGVSLGTYDIGASGITVTEERMESLDFSDPYYSENLIIVVRGEETSGRTLADFENATLGVIVGSIYEGYSKELFPNATIDSYQSFTDLFQCVKQGKIDGFLLDIPNLNAVKRTDPGLSHIEIPGCYVDIGYAFAKDEKGEKLQTQMNEFIAEIKENGTYDVLFEKWCGEKEPVGALKSPEYPAESEKLKICLDISRKPYVYLLENEFGGLEVEIMYLFCEKYGYAPEFESAQWSSGVAGLKEDKYDVVSCGIYITEERKESVNFCDPYVSPDVVMVIYEEVEKNEFLAGIAESFEKTFIREDRWKLIVEGIIVTVVISFFAVLFGSALGFGLYMLSRSENKAVSGFTKLITKICSKIIAGTPVLVILMILFYVIFGKTDIDGIYVAILSFAVIFSAFVYGHLGLTVESIDRGQIEAAYALGYNRNQTFFRIILPQALKIFMPTYTAEAVGLIKATAIVGYIAVNDLTKMGDIIRSNTYEAFFPLIAVAVIYFIITWISAELLGMLGKKFDPKKRKNENILKGVAR